MLFLLNIKVICLYCEVRGCLLLICMQWILVIFAPSAGDHDLLSHVPLHFLSAEPTVYGNDFWMCFLFTNVHISLIVSQLVNCPGICLPQVWPWSWWMRWQGLLLLVIARPTLWPHLWTPLTSIARSRKVIKNTSFHCNIENIVGMWSDLTDIWFPLWLES